MPVNHVEVVFIEQSSYNHQVNRRQVVVFYLSISINHCCPMFLLLVYFCMLVSNTVRNNVCKMLVYIPLYRWTCCYSCDAASTVSFMQSGDNVGLIPGGFQESTIYKRGQHRVYMRNRKGFIKVAAVLQ
jgi:hypothetical protein